MIINDKLVYLHIQKCGGCFISQYLIEEFNVRYDGFRNSSYRQISNEDKDKVIFASVRNPLDVYVSLYHKHIEELEKSLFKSVFKGTNNFDEWIKKFLKIKFQKLHDLNFLQLNYLGIGPYTYRLLNALSPKKITRNLLRNKLKFDHVKIIKFENFNKEFSKLLSDTYSCDKEKQNYLLADINKKPKIHQSKHAHFSSYYNDETENLVRKKDKIVFDYFGY